MSISTTVRVTDGLTPAFRSMVNSINLTISAFENLQVAADNPIDVASLRQARVEMNNANLAAQRFEEQIQDLDNQTRQFGNTSMSVFSGIKGLMVGIATSAAAGFLVRTSDQISQIESRINLLNDSLKSTDDLNYSIYESANRARGSYIEMANAVTKLGLNAPNVFSSIEETTAFMELLNKQFKIAGTTVQEVESATLQLTQALGSGVLRGEELNAVYEAAPGLINNIADYLGVTTMQLRDMASEGQITADVVKNAMFEAADDINRQFGKIDYTWSDRWIQAKNNMILGLMETSHAINDLANSPGVDLFINNISQMTSTVSYMLAYLVSGVASAVGFMAEYWNMLAPPIFTVIGLLTLFKLEAIARSIAQSILNAALYACPITWVIAGIMLVIGALFLLVGIINQVAGTNYSAIGIMAGAWNAFGAILYNIFLVILQTAMFVMMSILAAILWAVEGGANAFIDFYNTWVQVAEDVMNLAQTVGTAIGNAIIAGVNLAISGINLLIDALNKIPGFNIGKVSKMAYESVPKYSFASRKLDYLNFGDIDPSKAFSGGYKDIGAAWDSGYNWGANLFNYKGYEQDNSYQDMLDKMDELSGNNVYNPTGVSDGGVGNAIKDTAKNTEDIKNLLKVSGDNVEYLRDLAEREVINRFTTAEIKIDMTNHNTISSDMDIDGVVNTLVDQLEEAMATSAEGVHY